MLHGVIRLLRRMAGIAVPGDNKHSASRAEPTSPSEMYPCQRGSRHVLSLVSVKRAVSRDGLWSPDRGDSFAKIHS
jgi:hypothetical protein